MQRDVPRIRKQVILWRFTVTDFMLHSINEYNNKKESFTSSFYVLSAMLCLYDNLVNIFKA